MSIEIRDDQEADINGVSAKVSSVKVIPFVDGEGNVEIRRRARLGIENRELEIEEGSLLTFNEQKWVVTRIRVKDGAGLARFRQADRIPERFATTVEQFQEKWSAHDLLLMLLLRGVRSVESALTRLDDHPDGVAELIEPLRRGQHYLEEARDALAEGGESAPLVSSLDRYLAVCAPLIETLESSTQEIVNEDM